VAYLLDEFRTTCALRFVVGHASCIVVRDRRPAARPARGLCAAAASSASPTRPAAARTSGRCARRTS
jgi:hypothetical protein